MSKNLKFFLSSLLLSLPFWWGVNVLQKSLEDFLFWERMSVRSDLLMAQVAQENNLDKLKPIRNNLVGNLEIGAEAVISVFLKNDGSEKVLLEKNSEKTLPIASLTKLMTANVVLEHYDIEEPQIAYLLYPLLIASDNKAAQDLTGLTEEEAFVDLMNLEAKKLGLINTYFVNPTGLDPDNPEDPINYSTVNDLAKFARYITAEKPLIWEISILYAFEDNVSTNELLQEFPEIIGGKTGWTERAEGCLLLVLKAPGGKGEIINVILGSDDRFGDMKKLIGWINSAYKW
jgi:D-alanyl-D-alanine carboxypeptidase